MTGYRAKLVQLDNREQWLQERRAGAFRIGASSVAPILGASPYRGPWGVYNAHHGDESKARPGDPKAFARGHALEEVALRLYELETDQSCTHYDNAIAVSESAPWAICSPDASVDSDGGLVEIKTGRDLEAWGEAGEIPQWTGEAETRVPVWYAFQCYWQRLITRAPYVDLVWLRPFYDLRIYRLWPDERIESALLRRVGDWRERHLVAQQWPSVDGSKTCGLHIAERHGDPSKTLRRATEEEEALGRTLAAARADEKQAHQAAEYCGNALRKLIGDDHGIEVPGAGKITWARKAGTRGTLRTTIKAERS